MTAALSNTTTRASSSDAIAYATHQSAASIQTRTDGLARKQFSHPVPLSQTFKAALINVACLACFTAVLAGTLGGMTLLVRKLEAPVAEAVIGSRGIEVSSIKDSLKRLLEIKADLAREKTIEVQEIESFQRVGSYLLNQLLKTAAEDDSVGTRPEYLREIALIKTIEEQKTELEGRLKCLVNEEQKYIKEADKYIKEADDLKERVKAQELDDFKERVEAQEVDEQAASSIRLKVRLMKGAVAVIGITTAGLINNGFVHLGKISKIAQQNILCGLFAGCLGVIAREVLAQNYDIYAKISDPLLAGPMYLTMASVGSVVTAALTFLRPIE
jgi:hypothetical protein